MCSLPLCKKVSWVEISKGDFFYQVSILGGAYFRYTPVKIRIHYQYQNNTQTSLFFKLVLLMSANNFLSLKRKDLDIVHRPGHRTHIMDLRNHEHLKNFQCARFTFGLNNPTPINLTNYSNSA